MRIKKTVRRTLVLFRSVPVQNCKQENPSLFRHSSAGRAAQAISTSMETLGGGSFAP